MVHTTSTSDLKHLLEQPIDKAGVMLLCDDALHHESITHDLWELAKAGKQPVAWRALWVLDHATRKSIEVLMDKRKEMRALLLHETHEGSRRQLFNILLRYPVDTTTVEMILEAVLGWLQNPAEGIAIRANAVRFIYKVCVLEPGFSAELKEVLQIQLHNAASGGLTNVLQKTIAKLDKFG